MFLRNEKNMQINDKHCDARKDIEADDLEGSLDHLYSSFFVQRFRGNPRKENE